MRCDLWVLSSTPRRFSVRLRYLTAPLAALAVLTAGTPSLAEPTTKVPQLQRRALLSATAYQPGPISGTQLPTSSVNGITIPFPGQPIPGFSAIVPLHGNRLLAMP